MENRIYYINYLPQKRNTAGAKAPRDIVKICEQIGYSSFDVPRLALDTNIIFNKIIVGIVCVFSWIKSSMSVQKNSVLVYQHPMFGMGVAEKILPRVKNIKHLKVVALIHDLESLRKGIEGVIEYSSKKNDKTDKMLQQYDYIICHTKQMKEYLISVGFNSEKITVLEIFDYLCDENSSHLSGSSARSIAIAGNLAPGKCDYIYKICESGKNNDLKVHLFGNNYDESFASKNMIYHGSFTPEEIPSKLEGDFGLVWDGTSAKTCAGNTGEYLRYNCPHKTSLYLAAGMPVIIWSQAAMADFVTENGVGITVDSLENLEEVIASVDNESYARMCDNAQKIGKRLREGYYFTRAMDEVLEKLNSREKGNQS